MSRYRLIAAGACVLLFAASLASQAGEAAPGVAELLAKMPAKTMADGQAAAAELLKLGPAAVRDVCGRVAPPGPTDDSKVRFMLGGMAFYVSRPGAEADRKVFAGALVDALEEETRPEVKDFLVSMLQLAGKGEAVAPLGKLLGDEKLCGPAARALVAIATPGAAAALAKALPDAKGACRVAIVQAIAGLRVRAAVPALIPLAADGDPDTRREALFALATIGDPSAATALAKAADAKQPYDRAYATARYLLFAQRLAEAGQKAECAKICRELIKSRTAPRENSVVASALRTLVRAVGEEALADFVGVVDSPNRQLRQAALQVADTIPGETMTRRIVEWTQRAPAEERADVMRLLGRRGDPSALGAVRHGLMDAEKPVRLGAIAAAACFPGKDVVLPLLNAIEKSEDADEVKAIEAVLLRLAGEDVVPAVALRLPQAPAPARAALLDVLGFRRAKAHLDLVVSATGAKEPAVRLAAIRAFGELADEKELPRLVAVLLNAQEAQEQAAGQKAVVAACLRLTDTELRAEPILSALGQAAGPKRVLLLQALSRIGGKKALAAAVADTKSADAAVEEAAVRALGDWPDDGAADTLLAIARASGKPTEQVLALRGYVRLAGLSRKRPEAQTLGMFKSALDAAKRPEEKRLAIAGLAGVRSVESLELVAPFLDEPSLAPEAAVAAARIACPHGTEKGLAGPEVAAALGKALPLIKDANLRRQADAYLKGAVRSR